MKINVSILGAELGVRNAEGNVRQAQELVKSRKRERDQAKACGNYKNSIKNSLYNGKLGNGYDINVWSAENLLKQRKLELTRAKERAREVIKAQKAMEKTKKSSKTSSSTSSYSNSNHTPSNSSHTTSSPSSTRTSSSTSSTKPTRTSSSASSTNSTKTSSSASSTNSTKTSSSASSTKPTKTSSYASSTKPTRTSSWLVTLLLCMFFGPFGAHRFYVGKNKTGLLQLITFGGFTIWYLIDFIQILFGSFTDKNGNSIRLR